MVGCHHLQRSSSLVSGGDNVGAAAALTRSIESDSGFASVCWLHPLSCGLALYTSASTLYTTRCREGRTGLASFACMNNQGEGFLVILYLSTLVRI